MKQDWIRDPKQSYLSPREIEVITWTSLGKTCSEIAVILALSEETIRAHIRNICRKTCASNKTHAAVIAVSRNWIPAIDFQNVAQPNIAIAEYI
jgi:DNA-binding CsgD family transcriptional regulator